MGMNTKSKPKSHPKRDKNKRLLGAWVNKEIYQAVQECASRKGHKNASIIVIEALTEFLNKEKTLPK
jgi:hypothetical protein